jgi:flagellar assembly protein FliH
MEDIVPETPVIAVVKQEDKVEKSALAVAEAEVKKLKSELKGLEGGLSESRKDCEKLKAARDSERAELDRERNEFRANAAKEAAALKETSRAEGYKNGNTAGYADGLAKAGVDVRKEYEGKFSHVLALLGEIVKALGESRKCLAEAHASQLVRLWEMMLRKMLVTKVEMDPAVVSRVVENLLKRISDRERIIIYLNSEDITMIEEKKESLMDSIRGVKFFEFMSDDHIDKGSCLVETNLGIYDARWKTQLEQISSEVQNLLLESVITNESDGGD